MSEIGILAPEHPLIQIRRRTGLRNLTLRVHDHPLRITVFAPPTARSSQIDSFIEKNKGWLAERLRRQTSRIVFNPGVSIPIRGVPHEIVHAPQSHEEIKTAKNEQGEPFLCVPGRISSLGRRVETFLKLEARTDLLKATETYAAALNLPPPSVTIKDVRSRWGSCSSRRAIAYSWRLIMAPTFVLEYVAAHESAHLIEMNHSEAFWRRLSSLFPEISAAEKWLRKNGASLHRYVRKSDET